MLTVTNRGGTTAKFVKPVMYEWLDPDYAVVHSSIVDAQRDILKGLRGGWAETNGEDNFKTVQLVWASYEAAASGKIMVMDHFYQSDISRLYATYRVESPGGDGW